MHLECITNSAVHYTVQDPEWRLGMSGSTLSGISGLSYDSPFLSPCISAKSSCSFYLVIFLLMVHSPDFFQKILKCFSLKGPWTLILTDFSFRSPLWYIPPTKYFHTVNTGIYIPCLSNNFIFFTCLKCLWIAKQDQYVTAEWAREITAVAAWSGVFWPRVYLEL